MKSIKSLLPQATLLSIPTVADMIQQAAVFETNKEYSAALTVCNQILAIDPANSMAYQLRGIARIKLNDDQNGMNDLHTAQSLRYQSQPSSC